MTENKLGGSNRLEATFECPKKMHGNTILDNKRPAGISHLQDKIDERKRLESMIEKKKIRTAFWFTVSAGLALLMVRPWGWKTTPALLLFLPAVKKEKLH